MENIKIKIIPDNLKNNIDEYLSEQLFNANRHYTQINFEISHLIEKELYKSPEEFLHGLKERWNWHNTYYELLLEPAYENLLREDVIELSPNELEDIINIYCTSCLVDEATMVTSGAIKKYLDYHCQNINIANEDVSFETSRLLLITPPVENFFVQYHIDHLYYIFLLKTNDAEFQTYKDYLLKKYHAGDEKIFASRFQKKFKRNLLMSEEELLKDIEGYKVSENYKIQHYYFTIEHSDRKAIRDIILFDNLDEKLIACNLIGISGFLFRKKLLDYLNQSGILTSNGYIYEFDNDTIVNALKALKNERKTNMDKNVIPYKQRGETCAICCMMMVLQYYKTIFKANWHDERRLYKIYGSKYMSGTPFSALAFHMAKKGLDTTIYHESEDFFNNNRGALNDEDFNLALKEYKEYITFAKNNGTKVVNGVDINTDIIKQHLQSGDLVILAGEMVGGYHAILLTGYNQNGFNVCDPLYKNKQIRSYNEIENFMNTSIGKWFISVNNTTKEKQCLLDNLDKYNEEANIFMGKQVNRSLSHVKK